MRVLYLNTKATKESLHKSLMQLVYGVKPTKKVSKELMDKDIKTLTLYLQDTEGFRVEHRNFHDIPTKQRNKFNIHPKFTTFIYKK